MANSSTKQARRRNKALDRQIELAFLAHSQNVQISILDIPKVFRAGYTAAENGVDVEQAVVKAVQDLRVN